MAQKDHQQALSRANPYPPVALVQLPFPSQEDPLPTLGKYYDLYMQEYREVFPEYNIQEGDLWEAPLWVAHMDGAIGREDTTFIDLSTTVCSAEACVEAISQRVGNDYLIFLSPLAQNFFLSVAVSRLLMSQGYRTVAGGNMVDLASEKDFTIVYTGLARAGVYDEIVAQQGGKIGNQVILGRKQRPLGYRPTYRLLSGFARRVPLVRVSGSHGCLFACTFCGDAWTKQLHLVALEHLRAEVAEIGQVFPETRIVYIGDKTFGQSRESVEHMRQVFRPELGYRLIVQTHITAVDPWLLDAMEEIGVEVVEIGFETADSAVLAELKKGRGGEGFIPVLESLRERGFLVVLNVLGGLPNETRQSQQRTLDFLGQSSELVWLYNLYNFVPYPKTPIFPLIRDRIVDWNFQNWREDRPVVFTPFHQSREESWTHFLRLVERATGLLQRRRNKQMQYRAIKRSA
jgi:uncharacterized radical SAM superfamily protein